MPFYARLGFEEMSDVALPPALQAVREAEISRGLDWQTRLTMRYNLVRT